MAVTTELDPTDATAMPLPAGRFDPYGPRAPEALIADHTKGQELST
jgi:hypothetical protein